MAKLSLEEILTRGQAALASDNPLDGFKRILGDVKREAGKEVQDKAAEFERKRAEEYAAEDAAKLEEKNSIDVEGSTSDEPAV